jgi:hypothetical protein
LPFLSHILHRLLLLVAFVLPAAMRWRLLAWPHRRAHRRQRAALLAPDETQRETLRHIIEANRMTEFGRAHAFDRIQDPASFSTHVPLRSYGELEPYIERHRRGESGVLVAGGLVGFAISGGSRGRPKPVPVTPRSLDVWTRAESLLAREAMRLQPEVARGGCLHILPCYREQTSRSTLPVAPMPVLARSAGFSTGPRVGVPDQLFSITDERLRYYLILRLSMARPVSMLRAASPGTLIILAEYLELLGQELLDDLASGKVRYLETLPASVRAAIPPQRPERALVARLEHRLSQRGRLEPADVWPRLSLLVCATTGSSLVASNRLSDRFGNVAVMDPGYRAAEGIFTWSWREGEGGLPILDGQYIEFLPATDAGRARTVPIVELELGRRYTPVLTGFNGMYRYVMDDVVEVIDRRDDLPRLAMVGRARCQVRLGAGRLEEEAVSEAINAAARSVDVTLTGYTAWLAEPPVPGEAPAERPRGWLARLLGRGPAERPQERPLVTLAVEPSTSLGADRGRKLLVAVEGELRRQSEAYDQSRREGELDRPCLVLLRPQTLSRSRRRRLADGMSGAHAPVPILSEDGWLVEHEDVEQKMQL